MQVCDHEHLTEAKHDPHLCCISVQGQLALVLNALSTLNITITNAQLLQGRGMFQKTIHRMSVIWVALYRTYMIHLPNPSRHITNIDALNFQIVQNGKDGDYLYDYRDINN